MDGVRLGIAAGLAALGGCDLEGSSFAFVERQDVMLSAPAPREGGDDPHGEAHELVATTATSIDRVVGDVVGSVVDVEVVLDDHRETRRDGASRVYGPFDDLDERDIAWLVKIDGDSSSARFEVWLGPRGTDREDALVLAMHGEIDEQDGRRTGEVTLEYDAIDPRSELRPAGEHLTGRATVVFDRATGDGDARIEVSFTDFVREDDASPTWPSDAPLVHTRDANGGGTLNATLDVAAVATGVLADLAVDRVELDARWDDVAAGRARARAAPPANPESALPHGDLLVHECFDGGGGLTFRALNEPYAVDRPSYAFGDAATCVFADSDLP